MDDPAPNTPPSSESSPPAAQDGAGVLLVVAGVLTVVAGTLGTLWLLERGDRAAAEREVQQLRRRLHRAQGGGGIEALVAAQGAGEAVRPVRREDLDEQPCILNGERRTVLRIGPEAGERLGFRAGDVIVVGRRAPATAPSGAGP